MAYSRAHLSELGISLWRRRDAPPASSAEPLVDEQYRSAPTRPDHTTASASSHGLTGAVIDPQSPVVAGLELESAPETSDSGLPTVDAEQLARIATMNWDELRGHVQAQHRGQAKQAVFGVGALDAPLFVVGEAPGAEEDERGEPFVGRAGQLLDQMLRAIGMSRQRDVYIANVCKFRPPNNRDPLAEEIAADLPVLRRQIELVKPQVLLAVGRIAAQTLLDCKDPLGRMRGEDQREAASGLPMIVTYHPAYLLRSPRDKSKAWQDLKRVRERLNAGHKSRPA